MAMSTFTHLCDLFSSRGLICSQLTKSCLSFLALALGP